MSDLYEEYGLEMEPDAPQAEPELNPKKTAVVKKGGALGKVVCLLLGFVIGAGGVVGGVAGAGYYIVTQPVQDMLDTVNEITGANIDFAEYISPEYSKLKVMELIGELGSVAKNFASGQGCLNDLAKISPYVNTALDPLLEKVAEFGLSLNKEDLMAKKFSELTTYITDEAKSIKLIDVLKFANVNLEDPIYKALCYNADGEPVTIGEVIDNPSEFLNGVTLASLFNLDEPKQSYADGEEKPDPIMMALAFGEQGVHYDFDENGTLYWKEKEEGVYYAPRTIGDLLAGDLTGLIKDVKLATLLKIDEPKQSYADGEKKPDPIMMALAFGEQGVHYDFDENGTLYWKDNGAEGKYAPRTIGDLLKGDLTGLISDVKLATLLKIDEPKQSYADGEKKPDPIMMALAFGEQGVHYDFDENGTLYWKDNGEEGKYAPRTIGDLLAGDLTGLIKDVKLATLLNLDEPKQSYAEGEKKPDSLMMALAFGEQGVHYDFDENGTLYWLDDGEGGKYAPRTLSLLLDEDSNFTDIIFDMQLGTILDISPLDGTNDKLMLAIAYGEEGKHYKIVDGELVWQDKDGDPATPELYAPRTLDDLVNNASTLFDEIYLGTVLGISPLDNYDADESNDVNALMLALAFGYEDTDYTVNAEGTEITYIHEPKTIKALTSGNLFDEIRLATVLDADIYEEPGDPGYDAMTHAIAFGYKYVDYVILPDNSVVDPATGEPFVYPTVADMSNMGDVIEKLRLATVLDVEIDDENADSMTHALAFGYEGTHYHFDGGELVWNTNPETGKTYSYRTVKDMQDVGKILNELRIETALSVTYESPRLLHVLAYGSEGEDYEYEKDGEGNITGIKNITNYNTIANLSATENNLIESLKLKDILGQENIQDNSILRNLGDATLETLPEQIEELTISDILGEESIKDDLILSHLGDAKLNNLADKISELTFKQIYPDQIYESRTNASGELEYKYEFWYKVTNGVVDTSSKINESSGNYIAKDKLVYNGTDGYYHYVEDGQEYRVHLKLTGQWKYLLKASDDPDGYAHDYKLTDFTSLITNMTGNMTTAKLYDLNADGIISLTEAELSTEIVTQMTFMGHTYNFPINGIDPGASVTLGDLTVTQIMSYTAKLIQFVNGLRGPSST